MINTEAHLEELLEVVHRADEAIMEVYGRSDIAVETKADDTPLTEADLASNRILTEGISRLFPNIPIVSEEGDEEKNRLTVKSERFWLVDPLDGTKEFLVRTGHFTVCVALIEQDSPSFGIISAPALNTIYYGGLVMGSYRRYAGEKNGVPIHVSEERVGVVLGSRTDSNIQTTSYIDEHYPDSEIRAVGSQLKLPQIAEGLADAYPRIDGPLHLWDLAAGQAILEGAGGSITRPDGSLVDYHSSSLLVGSFVAKAG